MLKKEKIFILIAIVIIFILGIILFFTIAKKQEYNLEKVVSMINSAKIPENAHIKSESFMDSEGITIITDYFIKDKKIYIKDSSTVEILRDLENSKEITIINPSKMIITSNYNNNMEILGKNIFTTLAELNKQYENRGIYEYYGEEIVNGKKCIKVSLTDNFSNNISITYFYIDLESNYIVKYETYNGSDVENLNLITKESFEYELNTVTDDDILEFDINNYPDYEQFSNE